MLSTAETWSCSRTAVGNYLFRYCSVLGFAEFCTTFCGSSNRRFDAPYRSSSSICTTNNGAILSYVFCTHGTNCNSRNSFLQKKTSKPPYHTFENVWLGSLVDMKLDHFFFFLLSSKLKRTFVKCCLQLTVFSYGGVKWALYITPSGETSVSPPPPPQVC